MFLFFSSEEFAFAQCIFNQLKEKKLKKIFITRVIDNIVLIKNKEINHENQSENTSLYPDDFSTWDQHSLKHCWNHFTDIRVF